MVCFPGGWFLDLPPYYAIPDAPGWREVFLTDWRKANAVDPCVQ